MAKIVANEKVRHGKPVIEGTRISVDEVLDMLETGLTYDEIKNEYGLTKDQVLAVIKYASSLIRGEEVHEIVA